MCIRRHALQILLTCTLLSAPTVFAPAALVAQAPANTTQRGTVKAVSAAAITVATDANGELTVTPMEGAKILQLAPGSTDLKSAQVIGLTDIAAGDRVLVTGHPGDAASSLTAARIILMKSSDIASLHASQAADWQRRGTGGLVKGITGNTITVSNGPRTLSIVTTPTTIFRRYAGDSVKFEDAKTGSLADIAAGDQLRVRGAKSDDGMTITAEEIVSGSFENLAGALSKVDAAAGTITLKDLATKQTVTVRVTSNSDLRHLPPEAAAAYTRSHAAGAAGAAGAQTASTGSAPAGSTGGQVPGHGTGAGPGAASGAAGAEGRPGGRRGGMDLSQLLSRLPTQPLTDLKAGDAVLIVASRTGGAVTAVTLLSGVDSILSSSPGGTAPTLSPWNMGGGAEMEGGGAPGGGGAGAR
jgi:co-chaperonin GroES (HSP10)